MGHVDCDLRANQAKFDGKNSICFVYKYFSFVVQPILSFFNSAKAFLPILQAFLGYHKNNFPFKAHSEDYSKGRNDDRSLFGQMMHRKFSRTDVYRYIFGIFPPRRGAFWCVLCLLFALLLRDGELALNWMLVAARALEFSAVWAPTCCHTRVEFPARGEVDTRHVSWLVGQHSVSQSLAVDEHVSNVGRSGRLDGSGRSYLSAMLRCRLLLLLLVRLRRRRWTVQTASQRLFDLFLTLAQAVLQHTDRPANEQRQYIRRVNCRQ